MVGPKKQDFWPRINILKGFFFKSVNELWFIKKCQNCTFKVNFRSQKSTDFKKKYLGAKYLVQKIRWSKPKPINIKLWLRPINRLIGRPLHCTVHFNFCNYSLVHLIWLVIGNCKCKYAFLIRTTTV